MDADLCDRLQRLSGELTGNNVLLPVAVAAAELREHGAFSAPRVSEQLGGRLPTNRISQSLARLHRLGAVRELPYPGRPHARMYEMVPGPFWTFMHDWALDPEIDTAGR